jgi:hypothetical protein
MPSISRNGTCPIFLEYIIKQALIPRFSDPTVEFLRLSEYNFHWIDIPSYQRGVVWDDVLFEDLLQSTSVFLGSAILGHFIIPPDRVNFEKLPSSVTDYEILIDGLQRFSIGTALLTLLHPIVLADHPTLLNEAVHFAGLKLQGSNYAPIYQHNDSELQNHRRRAVRESYAQFRDILSRWLQKEFMAGRGSALASNIQRLFLQRQIAPDTYYGFTSVYEVTNTFIGLNTIRETLSTVDWLRAVIVDKGGHWDHATIENVDNRFTEVFMRENGKGAEQELAPFAAIILECLATGGVLYPEKVFPSWQTGLLDSEVMNFLDFVEKMFDEKNNPFYKELRKCGAIPFAGCICYYYRNYLTTQQEPMFISGGENEDVELLLYLRANYRVLFDGRIGRTRNYSKKLLIDNLTLSQISEELSQDFLGCNLLTPVDSLWLQARLKDTEKMRAPRVFNACILPIHGAIPHFLPHNYGTKTNQYQIDHMIPESALTENAPGESEGRLITNFAPLRRTSNNKQTNLMCSLKICQGGSYDIECANDSNVHPYIHWLIMNQAIYYSKLDLQELLEPNSAPPIADERIAWLTERLINRI